MSLKPLVESKKNNNHKIIGVLIFSFVLIFFAGMYIEKAKINNNPSLRDELTNELCNPLKEVVNNHTFELMCGNISIGWKSWSSAPIDNETIELLETIKSSDPTCNISIIDVKGGLGK